MLNPYFRASLDLSKYQKRQPEDVLKTTLWSSLVLAKLHGHSAYAISKMIYPDRYASNEFDVTENSFKFTNYQKGKHSPSDLVIERIEKLAPKTSDIFYHPLWEILSRDKISCKEMSCLGLRLQPKIELLLRLNTKTQSKLPRITRKSLDHIERFYNFDSLAALVAILKNESFKLDCAHRKMIFLRIYRTLLVLCSSIPVINFSLEFYTLICARLFAHFDEASNLNNLGHFKVFLENVKLVNSIYLNFEDKLQVWNDEISKDVFFDYFRGNYNIDLALKLMPPGDDDLQNFENDSKLSAHISLNFII